MVRRQVRPVNPSPSTSPVSDGLASDALAALGIRTELGLLYCGGKPALYRRLLALFLDDHARPFEARWHAACAAGDARAAHRLVHSLKSSSQAVGAERLAQAAAALEIELGNPAPAGWGLGVDLPLPAATAASAGLAHPRSLAALLDALVPLLDAPEPLPVPGPVRDGAPASALPPTPP